MNKDEMIKDKEQMARIIAFSLCPQRYHKKWWGENEKCYSDNNYPDCAKIKKVVDKLYNEKYRKLVEGEIVVKESEYEALLLEQKRLKEIVDRIPCGYVKIADDEIVIKKSEYEALANDLVKGDYGEFENGFSQGYEEAKQETAIEILHKIKDYIDNGLGGYLLIERKDIRELAKALGIELEDYCYKPYVEEKATRELIDKYGYELE